MNTAQLIVLWYAGLLIVAILGFQAMGRESANPLIVAIVVLAGLAIYTLRPHPKARKWVVALAVGGPMALALYAMAFALFAPLAPDLSDRLSRLPWRKISVVLAVLTAVLFLGTLLVEWLRDRHPRLLELLNAEVRVPLMGWAGQAAVPLLVFVGFMCVLLVLFVVLFVGERLGLLGTHRAPETRYVVPPAKPR